MSSLQKRCVNLVYSQVGREKLSLHELNKGTLVYSQAEGQSPPGKPLCMITVIKASQRNSFQPGDRIGFLSATKILTDINGECDREWHTLLTSEKVFGSKHKTVLFRFSACFSLLWEEMRILFSGASRAKSLHLQERMNMLNWPRVSSPGFSWWGNSHCADH